MNIVKLQAQLQKVPDQALIGYVQNPDGQVPSYLALAELTRRKEMRSSAAPQQPAPTQTVADQTIAETQPMQGVAALPVPEQMFNPESYASGGIVAFDEGGDVGTGMTFSMRNHYGQAMNDPESQAMSKMLWDQMGRKYAANPKFNASTQDPSAQPLVDYLNSFRTKNSNALQGGDLNLNTASGLGMAEGGEVKRFYQGGMPGLSEDDVAYQEALRQAELPSWMRTGLDYTAFLPYTLGKKGIDYLKGRQPVYDAEQGKYVLQRDLPPVDTKAAEDAAFKARMDRGLKERADYVQANPQVAAPQVAVAPPKPNAQAAFPGPYAPNANPEAIAERQAELLKNRFAPPAGTAVATKPASVGSPLGIGALAYKPYQTDTAGFDALMPEQRSMRDYAAEFKGELGDDPGRAAMKERLAKMQATGEKEAERAPWMALAEAGLGMAAGRSQFALQNIAEGGKQGLKSFAESRDNLRKAEERRFELESKVAQAERAEQLAAINYGADSKRYDDQNRRAIGLAKQADLAREKEVNARMEYESKKDKLTLDLENKKINQMAKAYNKTPAEIQLIERYAKSAGISFDQAAERLKFGVQDMKSNDAIAKILVSANPDLVNDPKQLAAAIKNYQQAMGGGVPADIQSIISKHLK